MSDATFSNDQVEQVYGDSMKESLRSSYRKAGIVMCSGTGIILELPDDRYYMTPEDIPLLHKNKPVSVIDDAGEIWGCAWLSPIRESRKKDIVATIRDRVYVISLAEAMRLLSGNVHAIQISEYHVKEDRDVHQPGNRSHDHGHCRLRPVDTCVPSP